MSGLQQDEVFVAACDAILSTCQLLVELDRYIKHGSVKGIRACRDRFVSFAEWKTEVIEMHEGRFALAADGPFRLGKNVYTSAHDAVAGFWLLVESCPENEDWTNAAWLRDWIDARSELKAGVIRERAKLFSDDTPAEEGEVEWTEAKAKSDWCREIGVSASTLERQIKSGTLVVDKVTGQRWRFTVESLRRFHK